MSKQRKPVHVIRLGRIRAAIWANETETREVWFKVTVTCLYRDGDRWREETSTYDELDLRLVSKAVNMACAWIVGEEDPADPDGTFH